MSQLHKYVPQLDDGSLVTVPTHGDCLAVERMVDAKRARAADLSSADRLEGLEPMPQEFHHRGLMIQVCINMHCKRAAHKGGSKYFVVLNTRLNNYCNCQHNSLDGVAYT